MSLYGYKRKWGKAPWAADLPEPGRPKRRAPGRSKPHLAALRRYLRCAAAFVEAARERGECCPVALHALGKRLPPNQVHHVFGRGWGGRGTLLLDERLWVAVSAEGHAWVERNRDAARAAGWLAPRGRYNVEVPADAVVRRNQWGGVVVEDAGGYCHAGEQERAGKKV